MMESSGREGAKCQKSKFGDIDGIIEIVLNDNKTKLCIVSFSSNEKGQEKMWGRRNEMQKVLFLFLERKSVTSL